jgi:hypothetical protein
MMLFLHQRPHQRLHQRLHQNKGGWGGGESVLETDLWQLFRLRQWIFRPRCRYFPASITNIYVTMILVSQFLE